MRKILFHSRLGPEGIYNEMRHRCKDFAPIWTCRNLWSLTLCQMLSQCEMEKVGVGQWAWEKPGLWHVNHMNGMTKSLSKRACGDEVKKTYGNGVRLQDQTEMLIGIWIRNWSCSILHPRTKSARQSNSRLSSIRIRAEDPQFGMDRLGFDSISDFFVIRAQWEIISFVWSWVRQQNRPFVSPLTASGDKQKRISFFPKLHFDLSKKALMPHKALGLCLLTVASLTLILTSHTLPI